MGALNTRGLKISSAFPPLSPFISETVWDTPVVTIDQQYEDTDACWFQIFHADFRSYTHTI